MRNQKTAMHTHERDCFFDSAVERNQMRGIVGDEVKRLSSWATNSSP